MKRAIKQLAIVGPTASGKSDLAIKIALKIDAYILSIDSLSIYKEINIVSAKPSKKELQSVKHFGINEINPDEHFSANIFIELYKKVRDECENDNKNLIIVGGTSFYLKSLVDGLSKIPPITEIINRSVQKELLNLQNCHSYLKSIDTSYMQNIAPHDSYRIEKALLLHRATGLTPTQWFQNNPPIPVIENLDIFNIDVQRDVLRKRISQRTKKMLALGLVDEVCTLEQKYTRLPNSMGAIGIVEVLEYLDGKATQEQMLENISIHTAQLAKRQQTFNRTQFKNIISAPLEDLEETILNYI